MRRNSAVVVLLGSALLPCCAGKKFETASAELPSKVDEGVDAGSQAVATDAGPSSDEAPDAALEAGVETTMDTPCGPARRFRDAPFLDEQCLEQEPYQMGSSEANFGGNFADHTPEHEVTLSPFFLDTYEVTVARYRACVEAGECATPSSDPGCTYTASVGSRDEHPVNCLTWAEADTFCSWDGRRLPTEAEWEFAAKGPGGSDYPWGNVFDDCSLAVIAGGSLCPEYGGALPQPVGSTPSGVTQHGIHDLTGNVAEWVADFAASYSAGTAIDPRGPMTGSVKIVRGSSWNGPTTTAVSFARGTAPPESKGNWGFRCARDGETP